MRDSYLHIMLTLVFGRPTNRRYVITTLSIDPFCASSILQRASDLREAGATAIEITIHDAWGQHVWSWSRSHQTRKSLRRTAA